MKNILQAIMLAGLFVNSADATTDYVVCNDCTETDYRNAARHYQRAGPDALSYDVYVADLVRENLRRFKVVIESEPGSTFKYVRQIQVSSTELHRFNAFIAARAAIFAELGLFDFTIEIPPGHFVGSAYDLWGSNQNQILVREYINAELSILERAFSDFFVLGSILLDRSASSLIIKVRFPDGSVAYFELTGKMEDLVWQYLAGQSVDQDGNLIPESLLDYSEYSGLFKSDTVQDFLMRAMLYNIPIVEEGGDSDRVAVVCVQDANGDIFCVVRAVN